MTKYYSQCRLLRVASLFGKKNKIIKVKRKRVGNRIDENERVKKNYAQGQHQLYVSDLEPSRLEL